MRSGVARQKAEKLREPVGVHFEKNANLTVRLIAKLKNLYETWRSRFPDEWRGAWLAYTNSTISIDKEPEVRLVQLCKEYFTKYGALYRAFDDLKEAATRLSRTDQDLFRKIREEYARDLVRGDDEVSSPAYRTPFKTLLMIQS